MASCSPGLLTAKLQLASELTLARQTSLTGRRQIKPPTGIAE
jgi:hypothetical protein